jgi:hypothetical protein
MKIRLEVRGERSKVRCKRSTLNIRGQSLDVSDILACHGGHGYEDYVVLVTCGGVANWNLNRAERGLADEPSACNGSRRAGFAGIARSGPGTVWSANRANGDVVYARNFASRET